MYTWSSDSDYDPNYNTVRLRYVSDTPSSMYIASYLMYYRIAGKFGKFGLLSAILPTKLILTINNLLADLLICQTFFCQMFETSQFTKLSHYTVILWTRSMSKCLILGVRQLCWNNF